MLKRFIRSTATKLKKTIPLYGSGRSFPLYIFLFISWVNRIFEVIIEQITERKEFTKEWIASSLSSLSNRTKPDHVKAI
jgi:hypothetical protein